MNKKVSEVEEGKSGVVAEADKAAKRSVCWCSEDQTALF